MSSGLVFPKSYARLTSAVYGICCRDISAFILPNELKSMRGSTGTRAPCGVVVLALIEKKDSVDVKKPIAYLLGRLARSTGVATPGVLHARQAANSERSFVCPNQLHKISFQILDYPRR